MKWLQDSDFNKIKIDRKDRYLNLYALIIATSLGLFLSMGIDGCINLQTSDYLYDYAIKTKQSLSDEAINKSYLDLWEIQLELKNIERSRGVHKTMIASGFTFAVIALLSYFLFITLRQGTRAKYAWKNNISSAKFRFIKKLENRKNKNFRMYKSKNRIYFFRLFKMQMISLEFNNKYIIAIFPESDIYLEEMKQIQYYLSKSFKNTIKNVTYRPLLSTDDSGQGFFSVIPSLIIMITFLGSIVSSFFIIMFVVNLLS